MSPSFRDGLAALGMWYVLDVPSGFTVWPPEPAWASVAYQGFGRPRKPRLRSGQRRTMAERGPMPSRRRRGVRLRWPREARDHAATGSVPRGCAQPAGVSPAKSTGPFTAGIWTAANPATICPMHRRIPRWRPWHTWAGSRWRIETEFETEKSDVGLDEYETRTWAGWHHHVALCLLGGAFLLSLQQAWGEKDAPDHEAAGLPGGAGNAAPGTVRT